MLDADDPVAELDLDAGDARERPYGAVDASDAALAAHSGDRQVVWVMPR
jgi:hypothetical protein